MTTNQQWQLVKIGASTDASAMDVVAAMEPGWNLGNSLDATGGETGWVTRSSPVT
ncbi:hypothetical protein [Isoptericola croceus]|uniref:hypothetical protein n=1 Tax=Isoptericola croceus TaxID=3031406 RepID=UPI0023F8ECB6|nr:hypothetical protein [Isoptericola croceus]